MTVSVIVPCYNAEPFVAQTIRSALEQTRPPDEVIVVDDGSTDGSAEVVRQFGDRVRLLTGRNGGASPTRNKGLEHATGDALMFLDADDVLGPTVLEALTDAVWPGAIAACPWYRLDHRGGAWVRRPASCSPRRPGQDALAAWLSGWYHPPCSVLWSRAAFDVVGRWDGRGGPNDDGHVMMQAFARGVPLVLTDRGEAFYRRLRATDAPSVSSGRLSKSGLEARLWVLRQLAETLEAEGRLGDYRAPLDGALERLARESEDYPDLAEQVVQAARQYAAYPWLRTRRRVARRVAREVRRVLPDRGGEPDRPAAPPVEVRYGLGAETAAGEDPAGSDPGQA